jgi:hypothetical protein
VFFYLIAIFAFIIELFSGTRSWFIIFLLIGGYTLWYGEKFRSLIVMAGVGLFIIGYIIPMTEQSKLIFTGSSERLSTVFQIHQKESEAGESIEHKLKTRLPKQLELIYQNPITGWGFTGKGGDPDVGVFGQLSQMGLIGFGLFLSLWYKILTLTKSASKNLHVSKNYRNMFRVFWIGFVGLLISHFTTNQIFGISYYPVVIPMYFWLTDFFLREAALNAKAKSIN